MRKPAGFHNHTCCPNEWKHTTDLTGSFELDAVIEKSKSPGLLKKVIEHTVEDLAYARQTDYNRYPRNIG